MRLFRSPRTWNVYCTRAYKQQGNGVVVTGKKHDVTRDFLALMNEKLHEFIAAGYIEVTDEGAEELNEYFECEELSE